MSHCGGRFAWRIVTATRGSKLDPVIPADLLLALADGSGRVALVVGAGCSLEAPTDLKLASDYSLDVHRQLVLDGVLNNGECHDPSDLSELATVVHAKHGRQAPVVERLPHRKFRLARPNAGYLITAALLREHAIAAVITLNFDLALSSALTELSATDVDVVSGPGAAGHLGMASVIYLHRNVDESNPERWILRSGALDEEWRESWEEVVARRVMSSPVVVFAGLGSPAAVLTETVTRIRQSIDVSQHQAYVVDPAESTLFEAALDLPEGAHIRLGWCAFMERLAVRVVAELEAGLATACRDLCEVNGWGDETDFVGHLCGRFHAAGLVDVGKMKAKWLLDRQAYAPDDARRGLLADLLLAVGLIERQVGAESRFRADGVIEVLRDGAVVSSFLAASGGGTLRWSALEAQVLDALKHMPTGAQPRHALLGGMQGLRPPVTAAPEDLVLGDVGSDIAQGEPRPELVLVEEIRADAAVIERLVA